MIIRFGQICCPQQISCHTKETLLFVECYIQFIPRKTNTLESQNIAPLLSWQESLLPALNQLSHFEGWGWGEPFLLNMARVCSPAQISWYLVAGIWFWWKPPEQSAALLWGQETFNCYYAAAAATAQHFSLATNNIQLGACITYVHFPLLLLDCQLLLLVHLHLHWSFKKFHEAQHVFHVCASSEHPINVWSFWYIWWSHCQR